MAQEGQSVQCFPSGDDKNGALTIKSWRRRGIRGKKEEEVLPSKSSWKKTSAPAAANSERSRRDCPKRVLMAACLCWCEPVRGWVHIIVPCGGGVRSRVGRGGED
eukprot:751872-Hanusia_phi.AAC.1